MEVRFLRDSNNTDGCKSSDDETKTKKKQSEPRLQTNPKVITASDVIKVKRQNLIIFV